MFGVFFNLNILLYMETAYQTVMQIPVGNRASSSIQQLRPAGPCVLDLVVQRTDDY